ncbi:hypothetical protein KOR42_34150 [Thalassoglobus neptunius]|uniref:Uncharacterized protein n=1 Tax=Thalassoglobus neptunius TaxID=1938619 RepID=A0A5C5WM37_9PLAN|nr:hypothetical protein [Thalassoglobus neptunius]TWT51728.1 hypothetical protein KOR42_34150 [Thalassoglobus neptunius]
MDSAQCWDDMLFAYATKQWLDASEHAVALLEWLDKGGFSPQPTIGTTTMHFTCQLDADVSRAICVATCRQVIERCAKEGANASR